ncbi:TetR/AcrR family transcriptional regulator [Hespellia stercorisuis]|uniref:Transcriptional regulator, TetR family n=1 Tax=Hespellia stercorisuis DSM 15480 TaxID=1121950 RepID=A0A1M6IBJ3_9FIRM|nr:TetR/AcrR family transcriptional regulator [Hespellia stercorisuis]SHJ31788.1 transcriptional regulator, TetR family [Hespellia stercorisuis DSM 15480]
MRPTNEKLASDILEAGKQEFLSKGFKGANLRNIASSLGVTTGAIYRYYTDKEEIFSTLVEEPAHTLTEKYRTLQKEFSARPLEEQLSGLPEISESGHDWMMEHIYNHYEAFKLIICCSTGTQYEHYMETLAEIETNSGILLMERMEAAGMKFRHIDEDMVHMLSSALFSGIFETVRHDMPREKAFAYMDGIREFYSAGWFQILGIS